LGRKKKIVRTSLDENGKCSAKRGETGRRGLDSGPGKYDASKAPSNVVEILKLGRIPTIHIGGLEKGRREEIGESSAHLPLCAAGNGSGIPGVRG